MTKPRPPQPPPTAAQVRALHEVLQRLAASVPFPAVTPEQLVRDGCHVFVRDAELIGECIVALDARPALYPDAPVTAAELKEGEAAAAAWRYLAVTLHALGDLAAGNALHVRAGTVQRSKDFLDTVIAASRRPLLFPNLPHARRLLLLGPAIRAYWADRSRRRKGTAKAPAKAPPQPRARPDRQKAQRRKAQALSLLGSLLSSLGSDS